jgi:hypothetical protein
MEASRALAKLDAARLEEIALVCQELISDAPETTHGTAPKESVEIHQGLSALERMIEATQANLSVFRDLRYRDRLRLEYGLKSMDSR